MGATRLLPLLTDSVFVVLALYFLIIYARSFFFVQPNPFFLIYQTFFLGYQLIALAFFVTRRSLVVFSSKIADYVYTLAAVGLPMLFRPVAGSGGSLVGEFLEVAGAILTFGAFLSLNNSFGIAPENRGIKTKGMYRIVRHPMYSGYLLTETGFVLNNFSPFNLLILATAGFFLVLRLQGEERLLREDPAYRAYARKTLWKLAPFLF